MNEKVTLSSEEYARLIIDFFHRTMMHHAMWFANVQENLGKEKALEVLDQVYKQSFGLQMNRLSKVLRFDMKDNLPAALLEMSDETKKKLLESVAFNWLANDGIWFQSIEFSGNMKDAKICNDASWADFSPLEAWSVKRLLNLPEKAGLEGLKKALMYRLYAFINVQSFTDETPNSFVFRMNDCRVQSARKRKGHNDYPCKSGGTIEYSSFASAIDSRIKTECICCPPDPHGEEHYCAWKFYIEKE